MSETIKFTQEELDQITKLRESNAQKINEFGQIELELMLSDQRLEVLKKAKEDLQKDYISLQDVEKKLVEDLNEKYGAGTVDISNGEFTPSN
jgi:hypothetical protein